jgi:ABC-type nitrate/sulfonate/bicarbonate transport system substrate-binding protein
MYWPPALMGIVIGVCLVPMVAACSNPGPQASPAAQNPPPAAKPAAAPTSASAAPPASSAVPAERPASSPPAEAVTLNVENFSSVANVGMYIANERGYFREEGIAINWVPFTNGADEIPALATGQLDIGGPTADSSFFNAVARGIELKIVATKGSQAPGHGYGAFVARKDLVESGQLRDYCDLRGKRIAVVGRGIASEADLAKATAQCNMTVADVDEVYMGAPDQMAALANGSIDIGMLFEPFTANIVQQGVAIRWKGVDEIYPDHQYGVVIYSPVFVQQHPNLARRWMVAYIRGLRDYIDEYVNGGNRQAIVDILVQNTLVKDRSLYDTMVSVGFNPNGYPNVNSILEDQDHYVQRGFLNSKSDPGKFVDLQYVESALTQLGRR